MREVVINRCYGGFDLSSKATLLYFQRKNPKSKVVQKKDKYGCTFVEVDGVYQSVDAYDYSLREDSVLLEVVRELGKDAEGAYSKLKIVEIPDDVKYEISEYDGVEEIHEVHRVWY